MSRLLVPYLLYVKQFLKHNPSRELPYHNNEHMVGVWDLASLIVHHEDGEDKEYLRLVLLFASLLHDYAHTGTAPEDKTNIELAVAALEQCVRDCPLELPESLLEDASAAIRSTEYPYRSSPVNLTERILRDADVLYVMLHHKPLRALNGLREEMQCKRNCLITDEELYVQQIGFMQTMELHTTTGQRLLRQNKGNFTHELEKLLK